MIPLFSFILLQENATPSVSDAMGDPSVISNFGKALIAGIADAIFTPIGRIAEKMFSIVFSIQQIETNGPLTFGEPAATADYTGVIPMITNGGLPYFIDKAYEFVWLPEGGLITVVGILLLVVGIGLDGVRQMFQFKKPQSGEKSPLVGLGLILFWFPLFLALVAIVHAGILTFADDQFIGEFVTLLVASYTGGAAAVFAVAGPLVIVYLAVVGLFVFIPYLILSMIMFGRLIALAAYLVFGPVLVGVSYTDFPVISNAADMILKKSVKFVIIPLPIGGVMFLVDEFMWGSILMPDLFDSVPAVGVVDTIAQMFVVGVLGWVLLLAVWIVFRSVSPQLAGGAGTVSKLGATAGLLGVGASGSAAYAASRGGLTAGVARGLGEEIGGEGLGKLGKVTPWSGSGRRGDSTSTQSASSSTSGQAGGGSTTASSGGPGGGGAGGSSTSSTSAGGRGGGYEDARGGSRSAGDPDQADDGWGGWTDSTSNTGDGAASQTTTQSASSTPSPSPSPQTGTSSNTYPSTQSPPQPTLDEVGQQGVGGQADLDHFEQIERDRHFDIGDREAATELRDEIRNEYGEEVLERNDDRRADVLLSRDAPDEVKEFASERQDELTLEPESDPDRNLKKERESFEIKKLAIANDLRDDIADRVGEDALAPTDRRNEKTVRLAADAPKDAIEMARAEQEGMESEAYTVSQMAPLTESEKKRVDYDNYMHAAWSKAHLLDEGVNDWTAHYDKQLADARAHRDLVRDSRAVDGEENATGGAGSGGKRLDNREGINPDQMGRKEFESNVDDHVMKWAKQGDPGAIDEVRQSNGSIEQVESEAIESVLNEYNSDPETAQNALEFLKREKDGLDSDTYGGGLSDEEIKRAIRSELEQDWEDEEEDIQERIEKIANSLEGVEWDQ